VAGIANQVDVGPALHLKSFQDPGPVKTGGVEADLNKKIANAYNQFKGDYVT
jgi:hypothetical protein